MKVDINGQTFYGEATAKKKAKLVAAEKAVAALIAQGVLKAPSEIISTQDVPATEVNTPLQVGTTNLLFDTQIIVYFYIFRCKQMTLLQMT